MIPVKHYKKIFKFTVFGAAVTGIGWVAYQIRQTKDSLNRAVDTTILNIMEPRPYKIYDGSSQILDVEPFVEENDPNQIWVNLWKSFKFGYAQRLISLSQSDSKFVRLKALSHLAEVNMDSWHCGLLANMLDVHTAVSLARVKDVNLKLFTEPPLRYLSYTECQLIHEVKELLLSLFERSKHPCLEYFISKAFFFDDGRPIDHDTATDEIKKLLKTNLSLLPLCLESILHHSSIDKYARDIVELNGLPILSEIFNRLKDDVEVNITMCRIISNLSFYPELLEELFRTGWIGLLAKWMRHEDIRVSIPAARALANLENTSEHYQRHVYLLHPVHVGAPGHKVDVVFVHGLLGGVFYTWRQRVEVERVYGLLGKTINTTITWGQYLGHKIRESISQTGSNIKRQMISNSIQTSDPATQTYLEEFAKHHENEDPSDFEVILQDLPTTSNTDSDLYSLPIDQIDPSINKDTNELTKCWPKDWLPEDCDGLRILGINYDTSLSMWTPLCPNISVKTNINEHSDRILDVLLKAGLGKKPIIWVAHSMGGLLVKNLLCKAYDNCDTRYKRICQNTKGIVFFSTPHFGSNFATLNQAMQYLLWPSIEVNDLREDSPHLQVIHKEFLDILDKIPMRIVSFVETKKTVFTAMKFSVQLVQPSSGNPGVGEYYEIPLDHLGICKPISRYSFMYRKLVELITEISQTIDNEKIIID